MEGDHRLAGVLSAATSVGGAASEHERRGNGDAGVREEERKPWYAQCHP
jgi:hypothetical protein